MSVQSSAHPIASVLSVVVYDANVLLVRRIDPPDAGKWGYPGGWIDPGETMAQAAVRELFETEVRAEARCVFNALDAFDKEGLVRRQFVMIAVLCAWVSGIPIAGDDATEAAWFQIANLSSLGNVSENVDTLAHQALRLMSPVGVCYLSQPPGCPARE